MAIPMFHLKREAWDKLENLSTKYHISCFELEDTTVWETITALLNLNLEKEDYDWITEVRDFMEEHPNPYVLYG